ncbi:shikimate dehydrogenase [Halarchaeum nitratireducens]|uniref:Shikimate dehydrogenase (NADP(+)) n=1 Tax=Halarchaeum nitratireducens TaxID=489913 RepID=A0A830GAD9_9EURY|nr:shikimate dehydrogenase [Halarchaeum nitratireducens]GGN14073.1 shikimate dehydrogenase [Halarchaeum nitratireducens]
MDVYGLIGNPVGHSLSPPMHEAAYAERGMDARYVTLEPDAADGAAAIDAADTLDLAGLNVTIPFKRDALDAVEPDDLARRVGAVNTVDFSGPVPTGHNTDVAGVRRSFERFDVPLAGADAVLVGAGGAARAAAVALVEDGASVHVANRTVERAEALADDVGGTASGLDTLPDVLADADVLVNATSVGMAEDVSPVPAAALHADLAVLDAVYSPLDTRLLREAAAAGATTIDGAWMLLYQGVAAFERWTGSDAPVDAMNDALRDRV